MFGSLTSFARGAIYFNLSIVTIGTLELFGYYHLGPKVIRRYFDSTPLPEKEYYSQPILVNFETSKFVFSHRGGKSAAESIISDTFDNNKLMKRSVFAQFLTSVSVTIGFAKERRFMLQIAIIGIITNMSLLFWSAYSGVSLWMLSSMVADGNEVVWENLNEARFAQRIEELENIQLNAAKKFGMFGTLAVITYCTPFAGAFTYFIGLALSAHQRLQ